MVSNLRDGVRVGSDAAVLAGSQVAKDIPDGRDTWAGNPAQHFKDELNLNRVIKRDVPKLASFFKALKKANSFEDLKLLLSGGSEKRDH